MGVRHLDEDRDALPTRQLAQGFERFLSHPRVRVEVDDVLERAHRLVARHLRQQLHRLLAATLARTGIASPFRAGLDGWAESARLRPADPPVAERFEVYVEGVELANGFHELTGAAEQRQRFEQDLVHRRERGLPATPIDERLLAALAAGLPDCAGVALGVDRLVMLSTGASSLAEVIAFPIERA